jgi:hypothetical protein
MNRLFVVQRERNLGTKRVSHCRSTSRDLAECNSGTVGETTALLCHAMSCYVMLYRAMSCYVMLCRICLPFKLTKQCQFAIMSIL